MLGVLPFVEDPDLSWTNGSAVPQHLPKDKNLKLHFVFSYFHLYILLLYVSLYLDITKQIIKAFVPKMVANGDYH